MVPMHHAKDLRDGYAGTTNWTDFGRPQVMMRTMM